MKGGSTNNMDIKYVIIAYLVIQIFIFFMVLSLSEGDFMQVCSTPKTIYKESRYNYPTCVLLFIVGVLFFLVPNLLCLLKFLTHVGRKEDSK